MHCGILFLACKAECPYQFTNFFLFTYMVAFDGTGQLWFCHMLSSSSVINKQIIQEMNYLFFMLIRVEFKKVESACSFWKFSGWNQKVSQISDHDIFL